MALNEGFDAKTPVPSPTLLQRLAAVLPKDINFKIYHVSTPPTRTSALFSAPPAARPDRTFCESHFLTASIETTAGSKVLEPLDVLIFAVEVLIYSTAYDTTFFISKADSTGFLDLLKLPKGTSSPIRDISGTFLKYLVEQRQRQTLRSIVSLFARAQDQYLFPGSVDYKGKHVLDDRGLVRWWCRVLNPLIEDARPSRRSRTSPWDSAKGYLVVPGLDKYETLSYIPSASRDKWTAGHPLRQISRQPHDAPPRCFIPHFPDDPKARFLDELDDEISKGQGSDEGQWKSVKTIEQFWEMMAYRQECSAGRMVGFIWLVFIPSSPDVLAESAVEDSQSTVTTVESGTWDINSSLPNIPRATQLPLTPLTSFNASSQLHTQSPAPSQNINERPSPSQQTIRSFEPRPPRCKKLKGPVIPRQPRVKTEQTSYLSDRPESTAYYLWRPEGRGQIVVEEPDYKRVTELLLRLDFESLEKASSSSRRWINEVSTRASGIVREHWGQTVTGTRAATVQNLSGPAGVNSLSMGLVRKKRKAGEEETTSAAAGIPTTPTINILATSMIRKKAKV